MEPMTDRPPREPAAQPRVVERSREGKFRRLVNYSPCSIHEISRSGSLISMNPAGLRILGVEEQADVRDTPYLSTVSQEDRVRVAALLQQALDGALAEFEFAAINDRQLQCTLLPIFDKGGRVEQVMGLALDVTDQRMTELSLQQLREGLAERSEEVERTESSRISDRVADLVSRDLRGPLKMISGAATGLRAKHESRLDEEGQELIAQVADGVHRVRSLVDVLFAYSGIESAGGERRPTSSADALEKAMENLHQVIDESRATIAVGDLPVVLGDGSQIEILFQTLLASAIRFGGGSPPDLEIEASSRGSSWQFSIKSTRAAAPEVAVENDGALHNEIGGPPTPEAGLGMTVCLSVVERHGGRIWIETGEDGESTVFFTLPGAELAEAPRPADGRPRAAG